MKMVSVIAVLTLFIAITSSVFSANASNATINVCGSDLYATVSLCTYWYEDMENLVITPVMNVTNNGSAPMSVSSVRLSNSESSIWGTPCVLAPSGRMDFALSESPVKTAIPQRAIKLAVVYTIEKTGE